VSLVHVLVITIASDLSAAFLASRLTFAIATVWQTWASDRLHNLDLVTSHRVDVKTEFWYWRLDLFSIALLLASQYAMWSVSFRFDEHRLAIVLLGPVCVAIALACMDLRTFDGAFNLLAKFVFLVQFLFVGYLGLFCNLYTNCGHNALIWFVYLPGFLCYLAKGWMNHENGWNFLHIGPHEVFHIFVYLGHLTTMMLDIMTELSTHAACFQ
jgi:hypothetical protein